MRAPLFWSAEVYGRDEARMLRAILTPLSWMYAWGAAQRQRDASPVRVGAPVICIGNLTLGGAGKTPIARALRARLGPSAVTLSRGYGGRARGPLLVTPDMDARDVGDEPLLHASDGRAWIARDRVAGARAAIAAGASAVIMDDGFQNPSLAKDLAILVIDAGFGLGNERVFPAGPLREPAQAGLARADAVILLGEPEKGAPSWLRGFHKTVLRARLAPKAATPEGKLVAFAGLARPEKFFDTLSAAGADIVEAAPFADHHVFSESDMALLDRIARERDARLITTEKDAVRLSPAWRERVLCFPVEARFDDEAALEALLAPVRARMV